MTLRFLNESPTHFLDAIRSSVNNNKFIKDDALMLLNLEIMISKMKNYDDNAIKNIATSDANNTFKACKIYQQALKKDKIDKFISEFNEKNKVKILNDIKSIEKRLLSIYKDAGVQVYKDN